MKNIFQTTANSIERSAKPSATRNGQQFNIDLFNKTGKCVVPTWDVDFYKTHLTDYEIQPVAHPQFLNYTKFVKL